MTTKFGPYFFKFIVISYKRKSMDKFKSKFKGSPTFCKLSDKNLDGYVNTYNYVQAVPN